MPDSAPLGRVHLVGAGPGDPGLLTVRASQLIAQADVILYDRLIGPGTLDGARPGAELLFVGKEGGGPSVPQDQTEALMVARARAGLTVVRLKGGDPFVFGRGGEEALTIHEAGIPFEVVPGITSGVAAPAYAGIPVTHRGLSVGVALVTGHEDPAKEDASLDWSALASFPGTLVFYMGLGRLREISAALIAAGRGADEPCAVIERGTMPDQRTVTATLATIVAETESAAIRAPAITVVGAVCRLAADLDGGGRQGPLHGRTIAITRARAQASELVERCLGLGASVIEAPTIRIAPISEAALPALDPYDLICLTSANAVGELFARLRADGRDARALAGARIAAIGPATVAALSAHGINADIVPARSVGESLVEALADVRCERVLIARAAAARDVVADALRARGATVDVLALYETIPEPLPAAILRRAAGADYITFTSSSTVRFFLRAAGVAPVPGGDVARDGGDGGRPLLSPGTRIVSIGPVTSATLREHGLEPHIEAARHDVEGVIAALIEDASGS